MKIELLCDQITKRDEKLFLTGDKNFIVNSCRKIR